MSKLEIITLFISLYGALLATILAVRDIFRQRRRIRIFLDQLVWHQRVQVTITNIGDRPITIAGIALSIGHEQDGHIVFEDIRQGDLFPVDLSRDLLPATLGDGEHITLPISDPVGNFLYENNMRARITVYDADGNKYKNFRTRLYNEKWGNYMK